MATIFCLKETLSPFIMRFMTITSYMIFSMLAASMASRPPEFVISPKELQNDIQRRIKDETQYIESFVLFDEVERHAAPLTDQLQRKLTVGTRMILIQQTATCRLLHPEGAIRLWKSWHDSRLSTNSAVTS